MKYICKFCLCEEWGPRTLEQEYCKPKFCPFDGGEDCCWERMKELKKEDESL